MLILVHLNCCHPLQVLLLNWGMSMFPSWLRPFLWASSLLIAFAWPLQCVMRLINSMQRKMLFIQSIALCFNVISIKKRNILPLKFSGTSCSTKHAWCFGFSSEFWHTTWIKKPVLKYQVTCWTSHFWLVLVCLHCSSLSVLSLLCSIAKPRISHQSRLQLVNSNLYVSLPVLPEQKETWLAQIVVNRE